MIDWTKIKIKYPSNYDRLYVEHIIMNDSAQFFQDYDQLVFECDFELLFDYHSTKFYNAIVQRINQIYRCFPRKKYTTEHLCAQIFLEKVANKDIKKHFEYQLYSFNIIFQETIKGIKEYLNNTPIGDIYKGEYLLFKTKFLKRIIWDVTAVVDYLEVFLKLKPGFEVGMNRSITGGDIAWFTNLLANGIVDYSNQAYFTTLSYLIRQSIELRIKNALGIEEILNNNNPVKITSDIFIDFIYKNKYITIPNLNTAIIRNIFKWCNIHIHMGISLYVWQFFMAKNYIQPLFMDYRGSNGWHISGAIRINKNYYQNDLKKDLMCFLSSHRHTVTEIILKDNPEAMLV